jgi:peroxiredoxin (alkyl hydroperoxide reductase subunit C)
MPALEARLKEFEAAGATILGVSADSTYSHDAWARHLGLSYPLLSDMHRAVCQAYGVYNRERNCARRATFIVDKSGVIQFTEVYEPGRLPDPDRLLQKVKELGD